MCGWNWWSRSKISIKVKNSNKLWERELKRTIRNVSKMNPSESKWFLIGSRKLHHITKSSNMNRTFNPVSSNGVSDCRCYSGNVNAGRHIAVLEIPPHRNPNVPWFVIETLPVRIRRSRRRWEFAEMKANKKSARSQWWRRWSEK